MPETASTNGPPIANVTATVSVSALAQHLDCSRAYIGKLEADGVEILYQAGQRAERLSAHRVSGHHGRTHNRLSPRFVEITEAISKLLDQVWYNRHQVWNEKLERGEAVLIEANEECGKDPFGLRIHRSIWEGAEQSARKMETKYGPGELGPWDDFDWGMINGKLSALRWVLGDDCDMLDT